MMTGKRRSVAGGGVAVEVPADRLVGWMNRFGGRNEGLAHLRTDGLTVTATGGDGTTATLTVPFGPMQVGDREPMEALLDHLTGIGALGIVLVRGGAHSIGVARSGVVLSSSTDRAYLQGRTAAGGWSQQRFARRRENQRSASYDSAADTAARVLLPIAASLRGLVLGGEHRGLAEVMADPRLAALGRLPVRTFPDIVEPRRVVLDEIAARSLTVEITIRERHE
jgi:Actinobacteria/chloroflexi VLRF1 release factor